MELEKLLKEFTAVGENSELVTKFSTSTTLPSSSYEEGKPVHAHLLISGDSKAFLSKAKLDDPAMSLIGLVRCPIAGIVKRRVKDVVITSLTPSSIPSPSSSSSLSKLVNTTDQQSHTLDDAIENDRRLTSRNVLKWIQQLSTTLFGIHRNYVTLRDFTLQDISLCSESSFVFTIVKWMKPKYQPVDPKIDDSRQAWMNVSTISRMSVYTELRKSDRLLTGSCSSK